MRMKWNKKLSSFILCVVLTVAIALSAIGCNGKQEETPSGGKQEVKSQTETEVKDEESAQEDDSVLGTGDTVFSLIEGEEGEYGLYVKTVNGITADYDEDGTYWAFYINGEYAQTGVDATPVAEGETYSFKVEK